MNIVIEFCHVELENIDTFSEQIIEAIVACKIICLTNVPLPTDRGK